MADGHTRELTTQEIEKIVNREKHSKHHNPHRTMWQDEDVVAAVYEAVYKGAREVVLKGQTYDIIYMPNSERIWIQCRDNFGFPCAWKTRGRVLNGAT